MIQTSSELVHGLVQCTDYIVFPYVLHTGECFQDVLVFLKYPLENYKNILKAYFPGDNEASILNYIVLHWLPYSYCQCRRRRRIVNLACDPTILNSLYICSPREYSLHNGVGYSTYIFSDNINIYINFFSDYPDAIVLWLLLLYYNVYYCIL